LLEPPATRHRTVDDGLVRGRRGLRAGVLVGVAVGIGLVRLMAAGGEDTTGPYALMHPGSAYPCAPIHYVISAPEAPEDFVEVVHGAVGKISAASGYRFYFDGMTQGRNFFTNVGPLLIGFGASGENPRFADDTIGLGGSAVDNRGELLNGAIMLDATKYAHEPDLAERQAIVMHELGHVLGLDHVHDSGELMNEANLGRTSLGPGDRAGLRHQFALSCPDGQ
jgi:hypothetical protein